MTDIIKKMNVALIVLIFSLSIFGFNACSSDKVTDIEDEEEEVVVIGEDDSDFEALDWTTDTHSKDADANFADLADISVTGRMQTIGFGNVEDRVNQRSIEETRQYDISTNINLGKMMPKKWGVQ